MDSKVDLYGFNLKISVQHQAERIECDKAAEKEEEKWRAFIEKNKLPPESKLKEMVRKGIPPILRTWVWMETSGAATVSTAAAKNYYNNMVAAGQTSSFMKDIETDLKYMFPTHPWLQSDDGKAAVKRVLSAFSVHNDAVGYCRSMNHIVAMLLVAMNRNEEKTFWLLDALIARILLAGTYSHNLEGCQVEMKALAELVSSKLPRLAAHMEALEVDMSVMATEWYLCLFATSMPSETVARVWDALFNEGPKILFRVALALLKMHEDVMLRTDNAGELIMLVREAAASMHNRDKLMDMAFNGVGSMPMAAIDGLREQKQREVEDILREREAARRRQDLKASIETAAKVQEEKLDEELPPTPMEKVEGAATAAVKNVREGLGKMVLNLKASTAKIGDMVKNTGAGH